MILSLNLGTQARKEKKQKEKGVVLDIMGCVARVLWALLCTAPLQGYTGGSRGKGGLGGCNPPIPPTPHGLLRGKPKQAKTLSGVGKWQPSLEQNPGSALFRFSVLRPGPRCYSYGSEPMASMMPPTQLWDPPRLRYF